MAPDTGSITNDESHGSSADAMMRQEGLADLHLDNLLPDAQRCLRAASQGEGRPVQAQYPGPSKVGLHVQT